MTYESFETTKRKLQKLWNKSNFIEGQIDRDLNKINIIVKSIDNLKQIRKISLAENIFWNPNEDDPVYTVTFPNLDDKQTPMIKPIYVVRFGSAYYAYDLLNQRAGSEYYWTKLNNKLSITIELDVNVTALISESPITFETPTFYYDLYLYFFNEENFFITQTEGF